MNIKIHANSHTPIYRQIVDQVAAQVASGRLDAGEQLPSVRRLADRLLVNPNTVARSYRELEHDGIVVTRPGAGVFVVDQTSPFRARQRRRLLFDRVEQLVAEAEQVGVSIPELLELVAERAGALASPGDGAAARRAGEKKGRSA